MITRIGRATIYVTDQDWAQSFYVDTLGFELVTDKPMGEEDSPRWIEVRPPGAETLIVLLPAEENPVGAGLNSLLLEADDINATYNQLAAKGVEFPTKPELAPWGRWWATFKDSEGNEFGLGQDA